MAVRIRMKKLGRKHRPYFRICAADKRSPRDGKVIEELGTYDPMIKETDARVTLNNERIDYWLSVGAQPSTAVKTFIKKYGSNGTHLEQRTAAMERLKLKPTAPAPVSIELPKPEEAAPAKEEAAAAPADEAKADGGEAKAEDTKDEAKAEAAEAKPAEEKPAEEAPKVEAKEEAKAEDAPADEAKKE